ncbi:MAG: hypothetical protein QGF68_20625, partial [Nitrospinota bacterium]|nr:hypothetical protein [Nitrospinota bacterium]
EINEIVYFGKCMPRQDTVDRVCSFFDPELETAHVQYDPDQANRILDEMGLSLGMKLEDMDPVAVSL